MIFCISIELVLKGKASFLICTTKQVTTGQWEAGHTFFYYTKILADNSGSHSFAAFKRGCPTCPPPLTLAKLNGVCLWIFEELVHGVSIMLPSLFIHTYMSNILIFFYYRKQFNFLCI